MKKKLDLVNVFCDGACKGNPGPGSNGVTVYYCNPIKTCFSLNRKSINKLVALSEQKLGSKLGSLFSEFNITNEVENALKDISNLNNYIQDTYKLRDSFSLFGITEVLDDQFLGNYNISGINKSGLVTIEIHNDGFSLNSKPNECYSGVRFDSTTNNIQELIAMINALKLVLDNDHWIHAGIYSDSSYVVKCLTDYRAAWEESDFKQGSVKNLELVKSMYELYDKVSSRIKIFHIKGHAGIPGNEAADIAANKNIYL